jgi:hypothetical protein
LIGGWRVRPRQRLANAGGRCGDLATAKGRRAADDAAKPNICAYRQRFVSGTKMLFECDGVPGKIEIGNGKKEGEYSLTFNIQSDLPQTHFGGYGSAAAAAWVLLHRLTSWIGQLQQRTEPFELWSLDY